jgi:hypothetical protein
MSGPDEPRGTSRDPDDWFGDAGLRPPVPPPRQAEAAAEPDWIEAETREAAGPPPPPAGLPRWRFALLGAGAFVALVVIAFAASGLFSSSSNDGSATTTATTTSQQATTTTPPATTTTPTTTQPAAVPTLPAGLLKQGTSGNDVKALQEALKGAGHSPGTIDGVFGPQTEQALIAFQQAAGIPADGVYGPGTKAALEKQLNAG